MKTIALLLTTLASTFAFSADRDWTDKKVNISYSSMYGFYSCDYAESQTEGYLKQLGAQDINVRCSGGLPDMQFVSITANFKAATPAADQDLGLYKTVTLESDESCDFNETIVKDLIKAFTIKNVDSSSSCWHTEGRFRYTFDVFAE